MTKWIILIAVGFLVGAKLILALSTADNFVNREAMPSILKVHCDSCWHGLR